MQPRRQRLWTIALACILGLLLGFALWPRSALKPTTLLSQIQDRGELRVGTVVSPVTYYIGPDHEPHGFEYELTRDFADDLGVSLAIVPAASFAELFTKLGNGEVDLLAAGVTITEERRQRWAFGPPYQQVTQEVVYRVGSEKPRDLDALIGRQLHVVKASSYEETLKQLSADEPALSYVSTEVDDVEALFAKISAREIDFTVADSNILEVHRRFYPLIERGFSLTEPQPVAWAFRQATDSTLLDATWSFLTEYREIGDLDTLAQRYYDHLPEYDRINTHYFLRHIRRRLPHYEALFRRGAAQHDLDWRLLAAMGYQESHWRKDAVSVTGVRGLMMLTRATAEDLGVADRLDPEQSILGGARYFSEIKSRLPQRISDPDRSWLALAAYNVGMGHLEDARVLTERQGGDPDRWADVSQRLPLLSEQRYYRTLRYGRARGQEPVDYVRNIRSYYDILVWHSNRQQAQLAATSEAMEAD